MIWNDPESNANIFQFVANWFLLFKGEIIFYLLNGNHFDFLKEKIILMLSMEWKMNPFLISPNHPNQQQKGGCSQNIQSFAMIYNVFDLIGSCCRFGRFCRSKATFVWFCKINDKSDFSETYICFYLEENTLFVIWGINWRQIVSDWSWTKYISLWLTAKN